MIDEKKLIWVVDDDQSIRFVLEHALQSAGYTVRSFKNADLALKHIKCSIPAVIITDVRMPGTNGMEFLYILQRNYTHIPIIIITAHSDLDSAVSAYEGGAFEYLPKPFDIDEAITLVDRAYTHQNTQHITAIEPPSKQLQAEIIGEAPAMQEVFRAIGRLSRSNITVLINGESGTGKELVAQALHRHSPRKENPFIALNMAAIPKDLMESELFGHEKGAFTGANTLRKGHFEQANKGSLFLDEIGDMPAELQTRLLRVLSDGEFYRVGGTNPIKVDVRIIAATHQNLEQHVKKGNFREDLFHRLNVIRIHLPALRERREDIPLLMQYFLTRAATELKSEIKVLSPEVTNWLSAQYWPGNVRQIENLSRWLTVMAAGKEIQVNDLPLELMEDSIQQSKFKTWQDSLREWAQTQILCNNGTLLNEAIPEFERTLIKVALESSGGRKQDAAKLLGWGRNTLTRKLQELNIDISM